MGWATCSDSNCVDLANIECKLVFQLVCKTNLSQTWHMYSGSPMECKSGLASRPLSPVLRTGIPLVAIVDLKVCLCLMSQ